MTLNRQLWLAISLLMAIAFVGSFVVSSLSAKTYLQQQLYLKNVDNVNSLALTLSASDADPVTMELMLNAQFDTGHYRYIRFVDASDNTLIERIDDEQSDAAPQWLARIFPIEPETGVAHVSNGWQQLGTLTLQSDNRFAYQELWTNTKRLCGYFVVAALLAGLIGSLTLRNIISPLKRVVDQANAMEQRRFITLPSPSILEFKSLTQAMNSLASRIKQMLAEESGRLDSLRKSLERDAVTGLLNREPFLDQLTTYLKREDGFSSGSIVIVRLMHLAELNREHGRGVLDQLLSQFGQQLRSHQTRDNGYLAGRLNGSDFVLLAPLEFNAEHLGREIRGLLLAATTELKIGNPAHIAAAAGEFHSEDTTGSLLSRIDAALANAESLPEGGIRLATESQATQPQSVKQLEDWQNIISTSLEQRQFKLAQYPVVNRDQEVLHWEVPSRLITADQKILTAAQFMPWISRLNFHSDFDCLVVELAIEKIKADGKSVGVNLLARTLGDESALNTLINTVRNHPDCANRLWFEVQESGVYQYLDSYRKLCTALKPLGCKLGIEHVGPEVAHIGELHDLGLDYLKIDSSLCKTAHSNEGNQVFIRGLCTIAHSIGLMTIAEGIDEQVTWESLLELGIDGGTGTLFTEDNIR